MCDRRRNDSLDLYKFLKLKIVDYIHTYSKVETFFLNRTTNKAEKYKQEVTMHLPNKEHNPELGYSF